MLHWWVRFQGLRSEVLITIGNLATTRGFESLYSDSFTSLTLWLIIYFKICLPWHVETTVLPSDVAPQFECIDTASLRGEKVRNYILSTKCFYSQLNHVTFNLTNLEHIHRVPKYLYYSLNKGQSLGEQENLWEHEPKASAWTPFWFCLISLHDFIPLIETWKISTTSFQQKQAWRICYFYNIKDTWVLQTLGK